MAGEIFVIADLHFGHNKAALNRGFASTDAHDDALCDAWNRVVGKRDVVYVLGDVFRTERLTDLPGIKKLVMGNHDQKPMSAYTAVFNKVFGCFEFDSCILTHIPVHPSQDGRYEFNVHGHLHANRLESNFYIPTSVEVLERMEPTPLRPLIELRRKVRRAHAV